MSNIYLCHCSQCFPGSAKVTRIIRNLKHGQQLLDGAQVHQHNVIAHLKDCIQKNLKVLNEAKHMFGFFFCKTFI